MKSLFRPVAVVVVALACTAALSQGSPTMRHGFNNIRVTPYPTSLSTSAKPFYYNGVQYYYDRGIYYQRAFYNGRTVYIPVAQG